MLFSAEREGINIAMAALVGIGNNKGCITKIIHPFVFEMQPKTTLHEMRTL